MNQPVEKPIPPTPEQKAFACLRVFGSELHPASPTRVPDWRWHIVQTYIRTPSLNKFKRLDPGIATAHQLYKYLKSVAYRNSRRSRKKPLPEGVMEAYDLYLLPLQLRAELQARLLAEEPLPIIAQKIHSTEAAITSYEHLFFNIFDRIQATSYISRKVIGLSHLKPNNPSFLPLFWMEMGYRGGPCVVDILVEFKERILEPLTHEDLLPTQDSKESILRNIKMLIKSRTTLFDPPSYGSLLDFRGFLELADREEQIKLMIQQIQEAQALATPLADMHLDHAEMHLDHEDTAAEQALFEYESILPITAHETAQKLVI